MSDFLSMVLAISIVMSITGYYWFHRGLEACASGIYQCEQTADKEWHCYRALADGE